MKKYISNFLICFFVISLFCISSAEDYENHGYRLYIREDNINIKKTDNDFSLKLMKNKAVSLPEKYDSRDYNYVSSVKNQGGYGACWAFASTSVLESYLLKFYGEKDYSGKVKNPDEFDIAEEHMLYMSSEATNNPYTYSWEIKDGGNTFMSSTYWLNNLGFVDEKIMGYNPGVVKDYSTLRNYPKMPYRVESVEFIPQHWSLGINSQKQTYIQKTKEFIYDYGAVTCSVLYDNVYLNTAVYEGKTCRTLYFNKEQVVTNHQVCIVGWDDNFPKENFKSTPEYDGAFIAKNSYGTGVAGGYIYISYCDYNLFADVMAVTSVKPVKNNEILYNIDPYASLSYRCEYSTGINPKSYGNIFKKKTKNEKLTKVMVNAVNELSGIDCGYVYDIYFVDGAPQKSYRDGYVEFKNYNSKRKLIYDNFKPENNGYYTLELETPVDIKNDEFSIVAEVSSENNMAVYIPIETKIPGFSDNAEANRGESFHNDGGFSEGVFKDHLNSENGSAEYVNFCIKAVTETDDKYSKFEFVNFTDKNGTEKTSFTKGESVVIVPVLDNANSKDEQLICVGYKDNVSKITLIKNISYGNNEFIIEDIPADFSEYTFYAFLWNFSEMKAFDNRMKAGK